MILTNGYMMYFVSSALPDEIVSISIPNTCWGNTEIIASISTNKITTKVKGRKMIFFNITNAGLCYTIYLMGGIIGMVIDSR